MKLRRDVPVADAGTRRHGDAADGIGRFAVSPRPRVAASA